MSQPKSQAALKQLASNSDHADAEFMHADSIYIDPKMSVGNIVDDAFLTQSIANDSEIPTALNDELEGKNSRKRREERQLRTTIEQENWLRSKFDLQPTEKLIASFSAALLRHILLQGRIYITTSHICFYTRLFGKVTKDLFNFASIKRVKKRRGGLVANAIKIYFIDDAVSPVLIGSLNNREKAFELIQGRLRDINPNAAERKDDDDGSIASVGSGRDDSDERSVEGSENYPPIQSNGASISLSKRNSIENSDADSAVENHPTVKDDANLVWKTKDDVVARVAGQKFDKRKERARVVLDAPVKTVFNLLYMSDWLKKYHEDVKNRDVDISQWTRASDGFMTREVCFRRPLAYKIGPKETRVKESQRYSFTNNGGVLVEIQGENLDVPYASCFVVESYFELDPYGEGASQTLMVASVAVNFVKSTFLSGTIESGALNETKTTFERMVCMAKDRICQHNAETAHNRPSKTSHPQTGNHVHFKTNTPKAANGHHANCQTATETDDLVDVIDADDMDLNRPTRGRAPEVNDAAVNESRFGLSRPLSGAENQDSRHAHTIRLVTLATLALTCLLLASVLITLRRLQHSISMLEGKILREEHLLVSPADGHCNSTL